MSTKVEFTEIDIVQFDDILHRVEANQATADDCKTLWAFRDSYVYLTELIKAKNATIGRLRKMMHGSRTEKTKDVLGRASNNNDQDKASCSSQEHPGQATVSCSSQEHPGQATVSSLPSPQAEAVSSQETPATEPENAPKKPRKGHGRNGADAYTGAEKVVVRIEGLQPGDPCPKCEKGTVYETNRPIKVVRLVGRPPIQATIYELQKLRCNPCGELFTAKAPAGVGNEKYDATASSMIALLKYGNGMPFHRDEKLQANLGIPLPDSTQWDIVEAKAEKIEPAFKELIRQAANGDVVHNDDTNVKILTLTSKRAKRAALEKAAALEQAALEATDEPSKKKSKEKLKKKSERSGLFTTGIVSTIGEDIKIALFFSGRQHAGENLKDVLLHRAEMLDAPIQMCDALSRNLPGELRTILAHCMSHGRRKFVDVVEQFPEQCRTVLELLAVIYHNDEVAREQKMSPQERLLHHQEKSGPTMEQLHLWLGRQLEDRLVEPNSSLGKAFSYMLKHWERLTLFLRVAGAPLDNNICERALKLAIRNRKNAMFYKTEHGAHVGDLFMSLIHTCELCGVNAFDYLTALERHANELSSYPQNWMPWNYRETQATLTSNHQP